MAQFQIDFSPVVFRNNRHQLLVSFMLQVDARPLKRSERSSRGSLLAKGKVSAFTSSDALRSASSLYASHSVLASGRWAKIRSAKPVSISLPTGSAPGRLLRYSKVKIYGYGGNLQNEALLASELQELPTIFRKFPSASLAASIISMPRDRYPGSQKPPSSASVILIPITATILLPRPMESHWGTISSPLSLPIIRSHTIIIPSTSQMVSAIIMAAETSSMQKN